MDEKETMRVSEDQALEMAARVQSVFREDHISGTGIFFSVWITDDNEAGPLVMVGGRPIEAAGAFLALVQQFGAPIVDNMQQLESFFEQTSGFIPDCLAGMWHGIEETAAQTYAMQKFTNPSASRGE